MREVFFGGEESLIYESSFCSLKESLDDQGCTATLINLEIPVLVLSLKSSDFVLSNYLDVEDYLNVVWMLLLKRRRVYGSNLLNDLKFYFGQILSLNEAKSLGKYLTQIFSFIKRRLHIQFVKRFGFLFGPNFVPL